MNVALPKFCEPSAIHDIKWIPLKFFNDARGWLVELFRNDLIDPNFHPVMAYISQTKPGVSRGPHEHIDQADYFCFFGPSTFRVYLWDARKESPTFGAKEVKEVGVNHERLGDSETEQPFFGLEAVFKGGTNQVHWIDGIREIDRQAKSAPRLEPL